MKYLLIDTANMFFRARHVVAKSVDTDTKLGLAIHVTLASVAKVWREFNTDHVIFCLEGRSWRKSFYEPYKKNRAVARQALTEKEQEEDELFWEVFEDFTAFLKNKTNCTVIQNSVLEADDLIAGFIQGHPNDEHFIISSDSDFYQLLDTNVKQYNGITDQLITIEGIFDKKGNMVIDKKTKQPKEIPNPEWLLFEKCMRGDPSDNVFTAYPRVRKTVLKEAFEDRHNKGYVWNNMMLQRWIDHNEIEHRVKDDYERNRTLVDLTAQPENVREEINATIRGIEQKENKNVGLYFLKFCGKHNLIKLGEEANKFGDLLNARYSQ